MKFYHLFAFPVAAVALALFAANADAAVAFDTTFGGSGTDTILSLAPVSDGYIAVGVTNSPDFPVTDSSVAAAGRDLFVAKLGLDGSVMAATRLGGNGDDSATGVVVDSTGLITVAGWTTSTDFPTTAAIQASNGGGSDALIIQLDSNLTVEFATYLGGAGEDQFAGVAHQANIDRFVFVGFTTSTGAQFPFPSPNGTNADTSKSGADSDGLLVAMARDRTLPLATFHGISSGNEVILAVAADPSGLSSQDASEVAITGYTDGPDFYKRSGDPLGSGKKLFAGLMSANSGLRLNSRVRSGNGDDEGLAVAYTSGKIIVGGRTTSTDFPVSGNAPQATPGGGTDALLVAFETEDFFSVYSTYLGGSEDDSLRGLAYDPAGFLHLAGTTASNDFPLELSVDPPDQPAYGGGLSDGFAGVVLVTGAGFGGFGPAIAFFPKLSFSGGLDEEGFLTTCARPDGQDADPADAWFAVAGGGRRDGVASLSKNGPRPKMGTDEDCLISGEGGAQTSADLAVVIRGVVNGDPVQLQVPFILEVEVTNLGPSGVPQGVLFLQPSLWQFSPQAATLLFKDGAVILPSTPAGESSKGSGQIPLGPFQSGETKTILLSLVVPPRPPGQSNPAAIEVDLGVNHAGLDPDQTNNTASSILSVGESATDLVLTGVATQRANPDTATPGIATFTVSNTGKSAGAMLWVATQSPFLFSKITNISVSKAGAIITSEALSGFGAYIREIYLGVIDWGEPVTVQLTFQPDAVGEIEMAAYTLGAFERDETNQKIDLRGGTLKAFTIHKVPEGKGRVTGTSGEEASGVFPRFAPESPLPVRTITATSLATGLQTQTTTNELGIYWMDLPPGRYAAATSTEKHETSEVSFIEVGDGMELDHGIEIRALGVLEEPAKPEVILIRDHASGAIVAHCNGPHAFESATVFGPAEEGLEWVRMEEVSPLRLGYFVGPFTGLRMQPRAKLLRAFWFDEAD